MSHKNEFYNYPEKAVKVYLPFSLQVLRLPSPSETAAATKEALWSLFPSRMGREQGRGKRSGHSQRNGLTAASILAEDSLNLQKKPTKGDRLHL